MDLFEFPSLFQVQKITNLTTTKAVRQFLTSFKQRLQLNGKQVKYQVRQWIKNSTHIQHLGIYFTCCSAKILLQKHQGQKFYKIEVINNLHRHSINKAKTAIIQNTNDTKQSFKKQTLDLKKIEKSKQQERINNLRNFQVSFFRKRKSFVDAYLTEIFQNDMKAFIYPEQYKCEKFSMSKMREHLTKQINPNSAQMQMLEFQQFQKLWLQQLNSNKQNTFSDGDYVNRRQSPDWCNKFSSKQFIFWQRKYKLLVTKKRNVFIAKKIIQTDAQNQQKMRRTMFLIFFQLDWQLCPVLLWLGYMNFGYANKIKETQLTIYLLTQAIKKTQFFYTQNLTFTINLDPSLMTALDKIQNTVRNVQEKQQKSQKRQINYFFHPKMVVQVAKSCKMAQTQINILNLMVYSDIYNVAQSLLLNLNDMQKKQGQIQRVTSFIFAHQNRLLYSKIKQNTNNFIGLNFTHQQVSYRLANKIEPFLFLRNYLSQEQCSVTQYLDLIFSLFNFFGKIYKQKGVQQFSEIQKKTIDLIVKTGISQNDQQLIKTIFETKPYQFDQIYQKCSPVILVQIGIQLKSCFCFLINEQNYQKVQKTGYVKVIDKNKGFVSKESKYKQSQFYHKFKIQYKQGDKGEKIWFCECARSKVTGTPCIHQMICCLQFKTSIFAQISQYWKQKQCK